MSNTEQLTKILTILETDEESPLKKFLSMEPQNDFEYLQLWFDYLDFRYINKDFFKEVVKRWEPDEFIFHYDLSKEINKILDTSIHKKLNDVSFKPRLEKYLELFPKPERENVRRLLLGCLYVIARDSTTLVDELFEIGEKFEIPQRFILSLGPDHKVFQDKVIEIEESSLRNESFHKRDIEYNSAIYCIFAGLDVHEEELSFLRGSELISHFNLADESFMEIPNEVDEEDIDDYEFDEGEDDEEFHLEDLEDFDDIDDLEDEVGDEQIEEKEIDEGELRAYENNLDYLNEEYYRLFILKQIKEKRKEQHSSLFDKDDQKEIFKLERKYKTQKNICAIRLQKSKQKGFNPRLEKLSKKIKLTEFEKDILIFLSGSKVFLYDDDTFLSISSIDVSDLLKILLNSQKEMVKKKKYFLKTSKLVRSNLIHLDDDNRLTESLFQCSIDVDNRLVEYLLGEDFDISDYLDGSFLYKSKIKLENVILPQETKKQILSVIENFPDFIKAKKKMKFSEIIEYGNSLVMLFVGPSGTGKTMLANALSDYLNQQILLFNLNNMAQNISYSAEEQLFSFLFREARMNKAILFFDESETMLEERFNDLLIEIEKHEGIVIFATNASFSINEAMRRRINLIVNFQEPGPSLRKKIWKIHLPSKLKLKDDVDLDELSQRYEINGGLIKNAVFSALSKAVNEAGTKDPIVKQEHLEQGAKEQLHNKLFMSNLQKHIIPQKGMEMVILQEKTRESINEIINYEKSLKVLNSEWGFSDVYPNQKGLAVLFYGPSGTGKTITAEAIAFETGKNIKIVNYSQVLSMWVGGTEKNLELLFKEVADNNSILLFDEADAIFAPRSGVAGSSDRYANVETDVLLSLIEQHNTFAILTTNYIENIDSAFFRRMRYLVEFKKPDEKLRNELWKVLLPEKLPLSDGVDINKLARDYPFTGGDIKNVIFRAATKRAVSLEESRSITMEDFVSVCDDILQQKGEKQDRIGF